ncbi:MAG: proteasome subunit beta [Acidimicrobiales bacterium]
MSLPTFAMGDDPGSDFSRLARQSGVITDPAAGEVLDLPHGTTCIALRFDDGVLIAGDRRATSGHLISYRTMQKVFPSDRHSAVAIAGAAGAAIEMVRLFQLQLEHYEKVEGKELSLDGKAAQLSQMLRQNLPAARAGMVVVPLFAGYDLRTNVGRLFQFDISGGRYEELEYGSTGSGSLHASTVLKLGFRAGMDRDTAVDLAIQALYVAADEDSASGLPDFVRNLFPVVSTVTDKGYEQVDDDEIRERSQRLVDELTSRNSTI